jgi:hypothetical protein
MIATETFASQDCGIRPTIRDGYLKTAFGETSAQATFEEPSLLTTGLLARVALHN